MKRIIDANRFGPWAVITGASSGIGKEFARQLASNGLNVVLVARRLTLLEDIGNELAREFGMRYKTVEADLSEEISIGQIVKATENLDVGLLISNAGTGQAGKFLSFDEAHLRRTLQLNAISHLQLSHHFGGRLAKRGKGGVLLTGAMGASDGVPYMANEAGTKSYILGLGRSLNVEFREFGVNVTVLVTSPTDTPVLDKLGFRKGYMPTEPLSVKQCVEEALIALNANRADVTPGRLYRMMDALTPGSIKRGMTAKIIKKNNGIE